MNQNTSLLKTIAESCGICRVLAPLAVAIMIPLSCQHEKDAGQETPEPPVVEEPEVISKGAYKHVVIIGVDGAGSCFGHTITPETFNIFSDGAYSYQTKTSYPTISAQCWGTMLHGVLPEFHGLTNDIASSRPYDADSPYPSVFRVVREAMPDASLVSICNWSAFNIGIIEHGIGLVEGSGNDAEVASQVVACLSKDVPTLLFAAFDSVDAAGHSSGFGSETQLKQLGVVDGYIGQIYDALRKSGKADETLFIVSTDHGGTPTGSHGGNSYAERYVFLGVKGKTVPAGCQIIDPEVRDIAAIAAYALGVDFPETWTGIVPTGVFEDVTAVERKEMKVPESEYRSHKTVPTPDVSKLKAVLGTHKVMAYLPFDGNATDLLGGRQTTPHGKLYYYNAWFGQGIALDDGYVTLENTHVGSGSFSVSFWMKTAKPVEDPSIISNKDWADGKNDGFVLSLRPNDIKFNVGEKSSGNRIDNSVSLPADFNKGWMHVVLTVDRASQIVRFYIDFKEVGNYNIPSYFISKSFDALDLNIGQDGKGDYRYKLPAQIDEMIITSDVLSAEDVTALKKYYQQK